MEICVQYNDWADCDACCGPCSSCTNMIPISTTPPHDEANCNSRAAGICNGSISNPGGLVPFHQQDNSIEFQGYQTGGCSHDGDCSKGQECKNGECVGDPGMSIDVKRMQQLANIIKKNKR